MVPPINFKPFYHRTLEKVAANHARLSAISLLFGFVLLMWGVTQEPKKAKVDAFLKEANTTIKKDMPAFISTFKAKFKQDFLALKKDKDNIAEMLNIDDYPYHIKFKMTKVLEAAVELDTARYNYYFQNSTIGALDAKQVGYALKLVKIAKVFDKLLITYQDTDTVHNKTSLQRWHLQVLKSIDIPNEAEVFESKPFSEKAALDSISVNGKTIYVSTKETHATSLRTLPINIFYLLGFFFFFLSFQIYYLGNQQKQSRRLLIVGSLVNILLIGFLSFFYFYFGELKTTESYQLQLWAKFLGILIIYSTIYFFSKLSEERSQDLIQSKYIFLPFGVGYLWVFYNCFPIFRFQDYTFLFTCYQIPELLSFSTFFDLLSYILLFGALPLFSYFNNVNTERVASEKEAKRKNVFPYILYSVILFLLLVGLNYSTLSYKDDFFYQVGFLALIVSISWFAVSGFLANSTLFLIFWSGLAALFFTIGLAITENKIISKSEIEKRFSNDNIGFDIGLLKDWHYKLIHEKDGTLSPLRLQEQLDTIQERDTFDAIFESVNKSFCADSFVHAVFEIDYENSRRLKYGLDTSVLREYAESSDSSSWRGFKFQKGKNLNLFFCEFYLQDQEVYPFVIKKRLHAPRPNRNPYQIQIENIKCRVEDHNGVLIEDRGYTEKNDASSFIMNVLTASQSVSYPVEDKVVILEAHNSTINLIFTFFIIMLLSVATLTSITYILVNTGLIKAPFKNQYYYQSWPIRVPNTYFIPVLLSLIGLAYYMHVIDVSEKTEQIRTDFLKSIAETSPEILDNAFKKREHLALYSIESPLSNIHPCGIRIYNESLDRIYNSYDSKANYNKIGYSPLDSSVHYKKERVINAGPYIFYNFPIRNNFDSICIGHVEVIVDRQTLQLESQTVNKAFFPLILVFIALVFNSIISYHRTKNVSVKIKELTNDLSLINTDRFKALTWDKSDTIGQLVDAINELLHKKVSTQGLTEILLYKQREKDSVDIYNHDLKNPINIMKGLVEGYKEKAKNTLMKKSDLDSLLNGISTQLDIFYMKIASLKDRFNKNEEKILLKQFTVRYITEKNVMARNSITFIDQLDEEQIVFMSQMHLNSIYDNMINNALDATNHQKNVSFEITLSKATKIQNGVRISFADNGPGIPMPVQQKILFANIQSEKNGGWGVALLLIKRSIDDLKGKVWFETMPTRPVGTVFHVELPIVSEES